MASTGNVTTHALKVQIGRSEVNIKLAVDYMELRTI